MPDRRRGCAAAMWLYLAGGAAAALGGEPLMASSHSRATAPRSSCGCTGGALRLRGGAAAAAAAAKPGGLFAASITRWQHDDIMQVSALICDGPASVGPLP
jgi:hypothetical protein